MPINALLARQHRTNLLQRHITPDHTKAARLALNDRHDQSQLDKILPLAPRNVLAPYFAHAAGCRYATSSGLDARFGGERDVLVVRHVEVAGVAVVDDVKAGGGDQERESES